MAEEAIAAAPLPVLAYEPMDSDDTCEPVARNAHRLQLAAEAVAFQGQITPSHFLGTDIYLLLQAANLFTTRHGSVQTTAALVLLGFLIGTYYLAFRYRGRPALFWVAALHGVITISTLCVLLYRKDASITLLIVLLVILLIVLAVSLYQLITRTIPAWNRIKYVTVMPEVRLQIEQMTKLLHVKNRTGADTVAFRDARSEQTIFPHNQYMARTGELMILDRGVRSKPRYWFAPAVETAITQRRDTKVSWKVAARLNWAGQQDDIYIDRKSLAIYDKLVQRDLPAEPL